MRERLREIAAETISIVERGGYDGADIAEAVAASVAGTRLYQPADPLPAFPGPATAIVEVTGESTLAAARRLGPGAASLNFASARKPGGGFRNGAQAQEESLARSSALYPSLLAAGDFYAHQRSLLYTDRVIYSPGVPIIRDDSGTLLPEPYLTSFLTAAAPNRAMIARNEPAALPEVPAVLTRRATRVLAVAAAHGHRDLVLGAWGCGVFGNDPAEVAEAFAVALRAVPHFDLVVFAIFDRRDEMRAAFRARFRG
ncbi:TIGR02452 family protein [Actinoplanes sp. NPDC051861]|uniref:TIGR02452 family protein n=1 Tax=Actinoplanes sp. NPDC051861 TaxID=3155170 RepID=UPI00343FB3E8